MLSLFFLAFYSFQGSYVVNMEFLNRVAALSSTPPATTTTSTSDSKHQMIVLHPLPRVDEISTDIDHDPRAVYFQQMEYGMYVRMAILYLILHGQQDDDDDDDDDE
jgi:aspartate carbamoyltransferase catalytic subunit